MTEDSGFRFLPHTTDVEFESYGRTLSRAFANAGKATFASMTDLSEVARKKAVRVSVPRRSDDVALLYDFLDRLVYLYDAKGMFFSSFSVRITKAGLSAVARGEPISRKHPTFSLVKSVTYHEMAITKRAGRFVCRVVLDV